MPAPSMRPPIRLLGRSGDGCRPAMPGLRAAVLLAQASTHLWHGRHEDVGALLDEALAEAQQDSMPGLELEVLGMMAFVDSYWSRTNHADDAARRADALRKHKGLGLPPALELAAALRSLIAGEPRRLDAAPASGSCCPTWSARIPASRWLSCSARPT